MRAERWLVFGAVLLCGLSSLWADQSESLKGVTGVKIEIATSPDDFSEANGETKQAMKDRVRVETELRLRKHGINIVGEKALGPKDAVLGVNVGLVGTSSAPVYACSIEVEAIQRCVVVDQSQKNPSIETAAITWTDRSIWLVGSSRVRDIVRSSLDDQLDKFANDFLKANPPVSKANR